MSALPPLPALPAELPEKPEGWKRRQNLHMKVQGGGIGIYTVYDPSGRSMPFGYQYDTSKGGLTGFTLPDIDGVMGWTELRREWPKYLERTAPKEPT